MLMIAKFNKFVFTIEANICKRNLARHASHNKVTKRHNSRDTIFKQLKKVLNLFFSGDSIFSRSNKNLITTNQRMNQHQLLPQSSGATAQLTVVDWLCQSVTIGQVSVVMNFE